ncbi:BAI1-associated 3-like [Brachionus plicatilis]|uniref:BAI1-associated 3-like n=1 Tax=Brachionus plicatilis TaxID=10195 RepID=A0A3M7QE70_BRAPC|nr:BAI1-associated 3-like [Brachionus plicatilis]
MFNDVLTELTKVSSSSIEISNLLSHTNRIWKLIHWPDFVGSQMFFVEIVDSLSKAIIKYASQIKDSNVKTQNSQCNVNFSTNQSNSYQKFGSELDYFQRLVITANNLEKVRDTFRAFYHDLEFDKYQSQAEKQDKIQLFEINKAHLEIMVNNTCEALVQALEQSLEIIVANKILKELDQHMFYLFESPESASAKESISRLVEYLDTSFRIYEPIAFKSNFNLFLRIQWIQLLDQIECDLEKDKSRSPVFFAKIYDCLDILVDFFSSGNQGLETDFLQSVEKFRQLKKYLNYSRMDTQKLIITYYQEMVDYQNSQRYCDNGKLICRACFHSKDEILAIEILKCKNLLPMDQNGLSDPYHKKK